MMILNCNETNMLESQIVEFTNPRSNSLIPNAPSHLHLTIELRLFKLLAFMILISS